MGELVPTVLRYFAYVQNNSGGSFDFDAQRGISHVVIVQAIDWQDADFRASRIGLYFDGDGDCSCCGNRWDSAEWSGSVSTTEPTVYGARLVDWITDRWFTKYMEPDRPEVFVHLADGRFGGFVYGSSKTGDLRLTEAREIGQ